MDGELIAYDGAFLPHWKEFADALEEYQYALKCLPKDSASRLSLAYVELPKRVLDLLSNALESTHFKSISLQRNHFGRDGIEFALNYIRNNPILEQFRLLSNPIDHKDDVIELCDIIRDHPSIHTIDLDSCCGEGINGYDVLCRVMAAGSRKLKSIDLCGSDISTGESTFISDFLSTNPILEKLVLEGNQLEDRDAKLIAGALKYNTNLRYLDITDNDNITDLGWVALYKAEFDSTSLNSTADSNHTCSIESNSIFNTKPNEGGSLLFGPREIRQRKIYSLLCSRNREYSNVHDLDDVPVEFLPDMLNSIQQYSECDLGGDDSSGEGDEDVEALSIVYELIRRWEKAFSVYESLGTS